MLFLTYLHNFFFLGIKLSSCTQMKTLKHLLQITCIVLFQQFIHGTGIEVSISGPQRICECRAQESSFNTHSLQSIFFTFSIMDVHITNTSTTVLYSITLKLWFHSLWASLNPFSRSSSLFIAENDNHYQIHTMLLLMCKMWVLLKKCFVTVINVGVPLFFFQSCSSSSSNNVIDINIVLHNKCM